MWYELDSDKKEKYKSLMSNFASLSEAFSQKVETDDGSEISDSVAPIVNSKFQETAFQRAFNAIGEDIANTSYDASLIIDDKTKYLIGIKSFGIHSGDQKIAQFKASSVNGGWSLTLGEARENAKRIGDKNKADEINEPLYRDVAMKIAKLRNERIASSTELIRGFDATDEVSVTPVYHVLMPSKKGEKPHIHVGETSYLPIDIDNIEILGSTTLKNAANFKFTDGQHIYKYTDADSQLYMNFHNKEIVVDDWEVTYVSDAFSIFENLNSDMEEVTDVQRIAKTISWIITNKNGQVEENSGYNGFNGATKLSKANSYREKRIEKLKENYKDSLSDEELDFIINSLNYILLTTHSSKEDKYDMKECRSRLRDKVTLIGNDDLKKEILAMVYRPVSEMYIPIPEARSFHNDNPDFFGPAIGTFKDGSNKLALEKEDRIFELEFLQSGNKIKAYINQDDGKSIQSINNQGILGEWILRKVFQLGEYEVLTSEKLDELGINGVRLTKYIDESKAIGIEFIWIDADNPPKDAIGWAGKSRT